MYEAVSATLNLIENIENGGTRTLRKNQSKEKRLKSIEGEKAKNQSKNKRQKINRKRKGYADHAEKIVHRFFWGVQTWLAAKGRLKLIQFLKRLT